MAYIYICAMVYSACCPTENKASPLISIVRRIYKQKTSQDIEHIRILLVSNERYSLLSDAEQISMHSEEHGICLTNH